MTFIDELHSKSDPEAALRMKPYDDPGLEQIKHALASGETQVIALDAKGQNLVRIVRPVRFDRLNATWAVIMDVPVSAIAGPATSLAWQLVLAGF